MKIDQNSTIFIDGKQVEVEIMQELYDSWERSSNAWYRDFKSMQAERDTYRDLYEKNK